MTVPANNKNVVLISGGASGIGRAIAERCLAEGDSVHICDASEENIEAFKAANPEATVTLADIGNRDDVSRVYLDLVEKHGALKVLVTNAGVAGPSAAVEDTDEDGWERCIRINLAGTF